MLTTLANPESAAIIRSLTSYHGTPYTSQRDQVPAGLRSVRVPREKADRA